MIIFGILCRIVRQVNQRALTLDIGYDASLVVILSVVLLFNFGLVFIRQCCDLDCVVDLIKVVVFVLQSKIYVKLVQLLHTGILDPFHYYRSFPRIPYLRLILVALS